MITFKGTLQININIYPESSGQIKTIIFPGVQNCYEQNFFSGPRDILAAFGKGRRVKFVSPDILNLTVKQGADLAHHIQLFIAPTSKVIPGT